MSLAKAKVSIRLVPSGGCRESSVPGLFQPLESTCILRLMARLPSKPERFQISLILTLLPLFRKKPL